MVESNMLKFVFILIFIKKTLCADQVNSIEYGGKVPELGEFDLYFTYEADGDRECEIALKRPSEKWKIYGLKKVICEAGANKLKALTLVKDNSPVGNDYVLEVKILNNGIQSAYKNWDVSVEAGRQGFYINNGAVYDANLNEFIYRGVNNHHVWFDSYNRWIAYGALTHIAAAKANSVRIVWMKNTVMNSTDLDKILKECVRLNLVPMVELHDVTIRFD